MESEKVKEIKKALEQQGNCGIMYEVNNHKRTCKFINYTDILTLINELESENERLNKSDTSKENAMNEYYNLYKDFKRENQQLKDRIAELEGEITKSDIINSKLEMDIELLNKQNIDLEIDRDYYQEQFNEQEDFYVEWNKQQLEQFAERLKDRLRYTSPTSDVLELSGLEFDGVEVEQCIDETLKEFINESKI